MKRLAFLSLVLGHTLIGMMGAARAQDDLDFEMMEMEDDAFNLDALDVDGQAKKRPSVSDRMKVMRDRMEQKTEDRVLKKIEDTRMKEELKLTKKLQNMFNGQEMGLDDETQSDQVGQQVAATEVVAPTVVEVSAPVEEVPTFKKVKITPQVGVTAMQTDSIDFESTYNAGLSVDSRLSEHFSVGIGFSFTKMTIKDYSNAQNPFYSGPNYSPYSYSAYGSYYSPYSSYSPYYGDYYDWYNSQYGVREIGYTGMSIELNGKFYIIGQGIVQPYVGAGLAYNRTKLSYDEDETTSTYTGSYSPYSNVQFGNEAYTGSYVSGNLLAGTDIMFTDTFGLNVQFKYSKGLTSSSQEYSQSTLSNPDQLFLNQLGEEIDSAHQATVTAGINVAF